MQRVHRLVSNYLKQGYFPISLFVWRSMARNLIQFAHQIVLYVPVALWAGISLSWSAWLFVPAFLLLLVNAQALGLALGLVCTRFRDVTQIVTSVMQMLMFLTPVFWLPESLPGRAQYILWNPFAQMLDLLRAPLMGGVAAAHNWWGILVWTALSLVVSSLLFSKIPPPRRLLAVKRTWLSSPSRTSRSTSPSTAPAPPR